MAVNVALTCVRVFRKQPRVLWNSARVGAHTVMSVSCGRLHTVALIPAQSRGQDRLFLLV